VVFWTPDRFLLVYWLGFVHSNHVERGNIVTAKTLARKIAQFALAKKASDVIIVDLRAVTPVTDFFVICSADSDTQVKAIADAVRSGTEKLGQDAWHDEGYSHLNWVLLDYVDVVAHVFRKEVRAYYNLERLWGDAKFECVQDDAAKTLTRKVRRSSKSSKKEVS
jgi:ribosome-associated protein